MIIRTAIRSRRRDLCPSSADLYSVPSSQPNTIDIFRVDRRFLLPFLDLDRCCLFLRRHRQQNDGNRVILQLLFANCEPT